MRLVKFLMYWAGPIVVSKIVITSFMKVYPTLIFGWFSEFFLN